MRMISTRTPDAAPGQGRAGGEDPGIPLAEALSRGLAPDGGLYLPRRLPRLSGPEVAALQGAPPARVAESIVAAFLDDGDGAGDGFVAGGAGGAGDADNAALRAALPELCDHAFAPPLVLRALDRGGEGSVELLELWHGPTGAFKDFAARFLIRALALRGSPVHVLVATSGDTGSAVAAAVEAEADRGADLRVTVLFPAEGVSARQAHLLSCFGPRVRSYRVEGSFDDAQQMVKSVLADPVLVARHRLTSANSISLGRLLPQATWFAWAALARPGVGFVVPSGNFGHGLAALWARAMGFPVGPVHLATNRNRALVDWFESGRSRPRASVQTPANAMDVGMPSNLERLQFQVGREPGIQARVTAAAVPDAAILASLARAPERWGTVICPHTACAFHALENGAVPSNAEGWVVASTAHPAKFPDVVEPAIGTSVPLPPALALLLARPARAEPLAATPRALADTLPAETW